MTIFELFSGLLITLSVFPFQFFPTRSVNRNLFYLRLARAVFENASMVNGEGRNGHCRTWCIRQEEKNLFYEKQKVFTPGQNAEMSNLETVRYVAWIDYTFNGMSRHRKLEFRPKGTERDISKLFPAIGSHFSLFVYEVIFSEIS